MTKKIIETILALTKWIIKREKLFRELQKQKFLNGIHMLKKKASWFSQTLAMKSDTEEKLQEEEVQEEEVQEEEVQEEEAYKKKQVKEGEEKIENKFEEIEETVETKQSVTQPTVVESPSPEKDVADLSKEEKSMLNLFKTMAPIQWINKTGT